jgi:arylsulfatase A-like enzyme
MIWDTPMLARDDYNYTRGFEGQTFVRSQKGDTWITDPSLPIRLPAQPHKIKNVKSLQGYLRNHHHRTLEREFCVGRTITTAMEWLETNTAHESFFLWIDMWDPHEPFDCPTYDYARYGDPGYEGDRMIYPRYGRPTYMSEEEQKDARALYAGNVTLVDRWIGAFLDTFERLGLHRNTILIWATDHGHLFGDHDLQGKPGAELGRLYETTVRIPLLVYHPEGIGAGSHVEAIVQAPDLLPSVLEALEIPAPSEVEGLSFWPAVSQPEAAGARDYAFSNRFPPSAGTVGYAAVEGQAFDGWVGSDRTVEPATITSTDRALVLPPKGLPAELYDLDRDGEQQRNVIDEEPETAAAMEKAWIEFLRERGATEERLRPFVEGNPGSLLANEARLHAFRDDLDRWIAFPTEREARGAGDGRTVRQILFGDLLADNPRNLVFLYDQYYWTDDLASS